MIPERLRNSLVAFTALIVLLTVAPGVSSEWGAFNVAQDSLARGKSASRTSVFPNGQVPIDSWLQLGDGRGAIFIPDPVALALGKANEQMPTTTGIVQLFVGSALLGAATEVGRKIAGAVVDIHQQYPIDPEASGSGEEYSAEEYSN